MLPGPRAQVEDPIRRADGLFIVLHHQDGVAMSRSSFRVFSRRALSRGAGRWRLIQDIQNAHQTRANLGCQADALRLTAGKRGRRALQGQVIQPYVHQEAQASWISRRMRSAIACWRVFNGSAGRSNASSTGRVRATGHWVSSTMFTPSMSLPALPYAGAPHCTRADALAHELTDLVAHILRVGLVVAALQVGDHPSKGVSKVARRPSRL